MSYLLDRKNRRKKYIKIFSVVFVFFLIIHFRVYVLGGLSSALNFVSHPVLVFGKYIDNKFYDTKYFFSSKKNLFSENENLKNQIATMSYDMLNYNSILEENLKLKDVLERKNVKKDFILGAILSKNNKSFDDVFVLDIGYEDGVQVGKTVFAYGNIPVGRVFEVFPKSSKVVLFSNAGEKTEAVLGGTDIFVEIIGRGGGTFEMVLPKNFEIKEDVRVLMPGIYPYVLASFSSVISDARDPFSKVLLVSPINIQELKFLEVEI